MTIHYSVESLPKLFLSEKYISDKSNYSLNNLQEVKNFLNSIEINKQYYRTGIIVKNPKYKKRVSDDTNILKEFKTSLNKLSSVNYKKLCELIVGQLQSKEHLYPLILESLVKKYLEIKLNKVTWHAFPPLLHSRIKPINISIKPYLLIKNHS